MISRDEILMGRDKEYPLTPQLEKNLTHLLDVLNQVRAKYGKPMIVTSGYRPGKYNKAAGGAKASAHLSCEACDFADPTGALAKWCLENLPLLKSLGLRMESPASTRGWIHLDSRYKPGTNVVFIP